VNVQQIARSCQRECVCDVLGAALDWYVGGSVLVPGRSSSIIEITRFQLHQFTVSIEELAEWFGLEAGAQWTVSGMWLLAAEGRQLDAVKMLARWLHHSYLGGMRKISTIRRAAHSRTKLSRTVSIKRDRESNYHYPKPQCGESEPQFHG
jgi:hypothetical protein